MTPTYDQQNAINKIRCFMEDNNNVCTMSGPAGSGKTTLQRMLTADMPESIVMCAPTNKAVAMQRRNGFQKATTLDKVLRKKQYIPIKRPPTQQELDFWTANDVEPQEFVEEAAYETIDSDQAGLLVLLDEASMSNMHDLDKLCSLYSKVLAIGDGFQLPPVEGPAWFQAWQHDIVLDKIHRTGEGSEITALANLVRQRKADWYKRDWSNEVTIMHGNAKSIPMAAMQAMKEADIVLAFKNDTCDHLNPLIRELRGLMRDDDQTQPVAGDWLLAWAMDEKQNIYKSERYLVQKAYPSPGSYTVTFFDEGQLRLIPVNKAKLQQQKSEIQVRNCMPFSFGHCITAHKSQGGEWDNVVVIASDKPTRHADYWNWLYTAVSRAKKKLTILR